MEIKILSVVTDSADESGYGLALVRFDRASVASGAASAGRTLFLEDGELADSEIGELMIDVPLDGEGAADDGDFSEVPAELREGCSVRILVAVLLIHAVSLQKKLYCKTRTVRDILTDEIRKLARERGVTESSISDKICRQLDGMTRSEFERRLFAAISGNDYSELQNILLAHVSSKNREADRGLIRWLSVLERVGG